MTDELRAQLEARLHEIKEELRVIAKKREDLDRRFALLNSQKGHIEALLPSKSSEVDKDAGLIPLDQFEVTTGMRPPVEVNLPDGTKRALKTWKDLETEVARYLVLTKKMKADRCPYQKRRARKEILVDTKRPNPGSAFSSPVEIGEGFWIETHGSAHELWEKTCFLIDVVGESPHDYHIKPSEYHLLTQR